MSKHKLHKTVKQNHSKWKVAVALFLVFTVVFAGVLYRGRLRNSRSADTNTYTDADLKRSYQYPDVESSLAALKKNPNDAAGYRGLAHYYSLKLDGAKTIANWKKAVELEPDNDHNKLRLGSTLLSYKQYAQAAEVFRQIENHDSREAPYAKEALKNMKSRGRIP